MVKDGCLYQTSEKVNRRSDNTVVLLSNECYGVIVKFIVDININQECVLLKLLKTKSVFPGKHKIF